MPNVVIWVVLIVDLYLLLCTYIGKGIYPDLIDHIHIRNCFCQLNQYHIDENMDTFNQQGIGPDLTDTSVVLWFYQGLEEPQSPSSHQQNIAKLKDSLDSSLQWEHGHSTSHQSQLSSQCHSKQ